MTTTCVSSRLRSEAEAEGEVYGAVRGGVAEEEVGGVDVFAEVGEAEDADGFAAVEVIGEVLAFGGEAE